MQRETRITIIILGAIVLFLAVTALLVHWRAQEQARTARTPETEAVFSGQYQTLLGQPFSLETVEAPVVLVYSWATWCPQCVQQLAQLAEMSNAYATSSVQVIAINRAEPKGRIERFIRTQVPALTASKVRVLQDVHDTFYQQIGAYTMPSWTLYNENQVTWHASQNLDAATLTSKIDDAVAGQ